MESEDETGSKVEEFDPLSMETHTSALIYGSSFSGKSVLLHWLAYHFSKRPKKSQFDEVYLFSTTCNLQQNSFEFVPEKYKIDTLAIEKIKEIMDKQKKLIEDNKRLAKFKQRLRKVPNVLLLFDDIVNEEKIRRSKVILELAIFARHLHISWIILSQNCNPANSVPRPVRANAHLICCNRVRNENDRKILMTEYFSLIDKKDGERLFNEITEPKFQFACIDLRKQNTRKLTDYIFKMKAPEKLPKFKLGSKAWWANADKTKMSYAGGALSKVDKSYSNPTLNIKPVFTQNIIYNYNDVKTDFEPDQDKKELAEEAQTLRRSKRNNRDKDAVIRKITYHS